MVIGFWNIHDKNDSDLKRLLFEWSEEYDLDVMIVDGEHYKFLYNPMWSFFGEKGAREVNGTYFNKSVRPVSYFWNIFDQVILRPSLLATFDEDFLQISTRIGATNLLNPSGRIEKR